jgi:hypothetical protein
MPGEAFSYAMRGLQEDDTPAEAGEGRGEAAVQTLLPPPGDQRVLAKGKIPNCQAKGCGGEHNHLLHDALMIGRALVILEAGGDSSQSYSCREDIRAEVAGKTDWGATLTLITHDAADRAGLTPIRHSARLVSGLGGKCLESTCFYVVPFVDAGDEIQTLRATGVARISSLGASAPPGDVENWDQHAC